MAAKRWKTLVVRSVKLVLAVIVLLFVGRHVVRTWADLSAHGEALRIEPAGIAVAVVLYVAGLACFGAYYGRIMHASPSPIRYRPALRAYYISHLGKYVPGKALVVVMRAGLSAPFGARPATAALATLYETLVMMAVGGVLAAVCFALPPVERLPMALSFGLGVAFLVLVEPRVFPKLSRLVTLPFPGVGPEAMPSVTWRLLGEGLLWSLAGWVLLGLSQVAVILAVDRHGLALAMWPAVIGSVALATVAGFAVAVMPAGLGVREWVLMTTLVPAVGREEVAVVSALVLRLTWVLGELLAAALFGLYRPPLTRSIE